MRKKSDGEFVYSIQLNKNKKIEASPPLDTLNSGLNRVLNASNNSVPQGNTTVNNNSMQETEKTKKISAIENNQKIILTSEAEIKEYINNSINRTTAGVTVAYGKVNERLSNDVKIYSNGKINIKDNFLEIVPYDIQHSYEQHHIAKEKGDKVFGLIDGKNLEFIRVSAKEYVYGVASQSLSKEEYKQKMRMSTSIIDLVENASITYDSPDKKNHKLFPNGFKNYQGRVGIDETIFKYIVRIGKAKDGVIFYDINLEVDGKVPRANCTSLIKSSTSSNRVPQGNTTVNNNSMQGK